MRFRLHWLIFEAILGHPSRFMNTVTVVQVCYKIEFQGRQLGRKYAYMCVCGMKCSLSPPPLKKPGE